MVRINKPALCIFMITLTVIISLGCSLGQNVTLTFNATLATNQGIDTAVAATVAAVATQAVKAKDVPSTAPTPKPSEVQPIGISPNAYADGISFVCEPALARVVKASVVDATGPESDNLPLFAVNPREDLFDFQGYIVNHGIKARLIFFSVKEYEKLGGDPVIENIDKLKKLLAVQPTEVSERIPDLPVANADRIFHSHLNFFNFQNGKAVSYLTMYAQDVSPVTNERLVYVVQGITDDGAYYVSGMFPVTHPSLPNNFDDAMKGKDPTKFSQTFQDYLLDVQTQLNAQKIESFTPNLGALDALVASVKITK
jgi:hypothetical protein